MYHCTPGSPYRPTRVVLCTYRHVLPPSNHIIRLHPRAPAPADASRKSRGVSHNGQHLGSAPCPARRLCVPASVRHRAFVETRHRRQCGRDCPGAGAGAGAGACGLVCIAPCLPVARVLRERADPRPPCREDPRIKPERGRGRGLVDLLSRGAHQSQTQAAALIGRTCCSHLRRQQSQAAAPRAKFRARSRRLQAQGCGYGRTRHVPREAFRARRARSRKNVCVARPVTASTSRDARQRAPRHAHARVPHPDSDPLP
ncbi:hypothetical protein V8D89_004218 [Ganoderma adspersum]